MDSLGVEQWDLKRGIADDFFLIASIPADRRSNWISTAEKCVPAARVHVRFHPGTADRRESGSGFFQLVGFFFDGMISEEPPKSQPDFDSPRARRIRIFSGIHDNSLMESLRIALPKEVSVDNIQMLTRRGGQIEECFRDENISLLNTYCSGMDVDYIYRTHFTPREAEVRYSSVNEIDLIYRCLGIILESIAFSGDRVTTDDSRTPRVPGDD
jgi:hypothetical protein